MGKVKYLPRSQAYWIIVKYQGSVSQSPNCWQKKKLSWTLYNHLFFKVNSVDWWWNTIMFEAKCCCLVSQMSRSPKLRKRTDEGLASDKYTNSFGDRVQHWVEEKEHLLETRLCNWLIAVCWNWTYSPDRNDLDLAVSQIFNKKLMGSSLARYTTDLSSW